MAGGGWEDRRGRRLGVCIVELQCFFSFFTRCVFLKSSMFFCHGSSRCCVVGGLSPPISQNVLVCEHCPRNANRPLRRGYQLCFVACVCCLVVIVIICFVGDYFGLRTLPGCVGFVGTFVLTNLFCVGKLLFWKQIPGFGVARQKVVLAAT